MMYYTIYKTIHKDSGKFYIGKHITKNLEDGYLGSGKHLKRAITKYGIGSFEKTILFVFDNKKEMDEKEKELCNIEMVKDEKSYNLKEGGVGGWDYVNESGLAKSQEHLIEANNIRLSQHRHSLKKWSENGLAAMRKAHKEGRVKYGVSFKGKHHTEETKRKMSAAKKGKAPWNKGIKKIK